MYNNPNNLDDLYLQTINQVMSSLGKEEEVQLPFLFPYKNGIYKVRILPKKNLTDPLFFTHVVYHDVISQTGKRIARAICKAETFNEPCVFCEMLHQASSIRTPEAKEFLSQFKKTKRVYFNAIFHGYAPKSGVPFGKFINEESDRIIEPGTLVILILPFSAADAVLKHIALHRASNVIFPETGRCLFIERSEDINRPNYTVSIDLNVDPIRDWETLSDSLYDLKEVVETKNEDDVVLFNRFYKDTLALGAPVVRFMQDVAYRKNIALEGESSEIPSLPTSQVHQPVQPTTLTQPTTQTIPQQTIPYTVPQQQTIPQQQINQPYTTPQQTGLDLKKLGKLLKDIDE